MTALPGGVFKLRLLDDAVATHAHFVDFELYWNDWGMLRIRAATHAEARTHQALAAAAATAASSAALAARVVGRPPASRSACARGVRALGPGGPPVLESLQSCDEEAELEDPSWQDCRC